MTRKPLLAIFVILLMAMMALPVFASDTSSDEMALDAARKIFEAHRQDADAQRRAGSFPKNTSSRACTSLRDQPFPMLDVAHLAAHEAAAPRPRASSKKRKREAV